MWPRPWRSGARADAFRDPDLSLRTNVAHAGQGTGNVAGSVQKDEFRSHNHTGNWGGQSVIGHDAGPGVPGSPTATGYTGGNETRPANAFVHYIITY